MRNLIPLWSLGACLLVVAQTPGDPLKPAKDAVLDASYLGTHAETRGFMLGRPVKAKPTPDGKAVLFLRSQARVPKLRLHEFDVASGQARELLTPEQVLKGADEKLTPEEKARRERMRVSVGGFTDYQLSEDGTLILVSLSGKLYVVKRATGAVTELATGAGTILDPKFSPNGQSVAYVRDHDVYLYDLATNLERRLTTGGTEQKTHGLAEFVAQEEMGRFSGFWWSPDSKSLAYEEADAGGVEVWYVTDPARPEQPAHPSYYPRPGKANVKVRLGVISVGGGETVWIDWDVKKYPYLAQVRWDKYGPLTVTVQSRLQNELALLKVDPATGKTTPLLTEKDSTWINLHQDTPRWLPDDKGFLWTCDTASGPQLEWRGVNGKLRGVVVPNAWGFQNLVSVNAKAGEIYFLASQNPMLSELYRLPLKVPSEGDEPKRLSTNPGLHGASVAKDHSVFVLTGTTSDAMPRTTVHKADGTLVGELPSVAESPSFTPQVTFEQVGDTPGFYAAVVRPHGFDARKKYPVIVDVYGGPGHNHVIRAMRNWLLDQWLADQGFIVVAIENRGTPGRGHDWERALYQKFGSVPLDDQVASLQALGKKYPEMDLNRVGIVGWSFGGYMSALAVLKRPDIYKAAVAGAPVTDWEDYDTHYTERYLGLPQEHAQAYKEASLLTYADKLQRPLLLVHGTSDDNVYFRHSLKLADALFRAGKDFELLPLSGLTHMVPDPVITQRLWSRIAQHFQKHLGQPKD